jgi:hypothetical protein
MIAQFLPIQRLRYKQLAQLAVGDFYQRIRPREKWALRAEGCPAAQDLLNSKEFHEGTCPENLLV